MLWGRKALKLVVTISLAAAVGFGIYLAGRFLLAHWAATALIVYVIGAGACLVLGIYAQAQARKNNFEDSVFAAGQEAQTSKSTLLTRWRLILSRLCLQICELFAWPAVVLLGIWRAVHTEDGQRSQRQLAVLKQLSADDLSIEPLYIALAVTVGAVLLLLGNQNALYLLILCRGAITYVAFLCVGVTLYPGSMAQRCRLASGNPYKRAILLAVLTSTTLVIAYTFITARTFPTVQDYIQAVRGLYSQFDSVRQIFSGRPVSTITLMMGISGALLASAVIQGLLSVSAFKRTDEDLTNIALAKLVLGRPSDALNTVQQVKVSNAMSMQTEAIALLGVDQWQQALDVWRRRAHVVSTDSPPPDEQLLRELLQNASAFPLHTRSLLAVFRQWLPTACSEKPVAQLSMILTSFERAKAGDLIELLGELGLTQTYPIALARLHLLDGNLDAAGAIAAAAQTSNGALEYLRVTAVLLANVLGPTTLEQDQLFFESWCKNHIAQLSNLAPQLQSFDELSIAVDAMIGVRLFAERVHSSYLEAIQFQLGSLIARLRASAPDAYLIQALLKRTLPSEVANQRI
jgi:hypothetical protein